MRVRHLGLPVTDQERSAGFYATYFGFDPGTARRFEDGTVIVQDADGFDLALHRVDEPGPVPEFLHFGFRVDAAAAVRLLQDRVQAGGVQVFDLCDEPELVSFKCADPDGHRVEVYWEP